MADNKKSSDDELDSQESLQLSFPLPPAVYYKSYTDANIKSGAVLQPPPVISGSYSMFGDSFDVSV